MWVTTHADNAASCPAGAVTAATQSLAIKLYTYTLSEQGNLCHIWMVQFAAHAWPLPEAKSTTYFPLLYHTAVYSVEVAMHAENDLA